MSDYRREYQITPDELAALPADEFRWLLQGLSRNSRFARACAERPKTLHDPDERAALIAAARR